MSKIKEYIFLGILDRNILLKIELPAEEKIELFIWQQNCKGQIGR
jgi:hypothetical protein